jgi:hypothetical protein
VYRSTDGGQTWFAANQGLPCWPNGTVTNCSEIHALSLDPTRPGTLYAGTSSGLYVSTDGAVNWRRLSLPENVWDVRAFAMRPDGRGPLVGTSGAGVLRFEPDEPRVRRHLAPRPR